MLQLIDKMKKLVIINCKAYKEAVGINAVKLAKICDKLTGKDVEIMMAVQPADVHISKKIKIKVLAQHIDAVSYGQFTGQILPENVRENGAYGTLLNHSEKKISFDVLKKSVEICKNVGLKTIVCASTSTEALIISKLKPDFIAIEPLELIGGQLSVSQAKPEVITKTTKKIKNIPIICGAGIHSSSDVKKAFKLGAKGILVSSFVCNAKNQEKALRELLKRFIQHEQSEDN